MPSHVEETCGQEEASSSALSSHSRVRSLAPTKHISLGDELKSVLEQSFRRKQQQHIHSGRTASKEAEDAFVTSSVEASESPRSRPALLVRKLSAIQQLVGTPGAEEAARKLQVWCRFHLQRKTQLRQELQGFCLCLRLCLCIPIHPLSVLSLCLSVFWRQHHLDCSHCGVPCHPHPFDLTLFLSIFHQHNPPFWRRRNYELGISSSVNCWPQKGPMSTAWTMF